MALGFTPSKHVIGPLELYHHVPPSPRALVFTFHGTGGDAKLWFELTEARRLMAALVGAGYAIATLDSIAGHATGGKKQWDLSGPIEENADYQNVVSAITLLKNQKIVSDDIPIVLMGGSNGGAFASAVSTSIDAEALVLHISRGLEVAFKPPSTPPPTAWLVGRNDDVVEYETANLNISNIEAAGVAHVFLTNEPAPLAADSLTRIDGVSAQQSATFFMKVQAAELLDACGRQLSSPDVNQAWSAFLPAGDEALFEQIRHQLLELHAGHTITSDFNTELVAFLHEHVK